MNELDDNIEGRPIDASLNISQGYIIVKENILKILLLSFTVSLVSFSFSFFFPDIYKSNAILSPAESLQGNIQNEISSLSFLGVPFPNASSNKVDVALEKLKSLDFFKKLVDKHQLLPSLIAVDYWDKKTKSLIYDNSLFDSKSSEWLGETLSYQNAHKQFLKNLKTNISPLNGLVEISYEHLSPIEAKKWLELIIKEINLDLKQREIIKAQNSLEYLRKEAVKTSFVEVQNAISKLSEEQMKSIMLASTTEEFVFELVSSPYIAEKPFWPKRNLIFFLTLFSSFSFFCFFFILKKSFDL